MTRRPIHRSGITMPINNPRFVNTAWRRGADGFQLDLQDSVPQAQKPYARTLCAMAVEMVRLGGGDDVEIRINQGSIEADAEGAVLPGVRALNLGHTRYAEQIRLLDACITRLERERGIRAGTIRIGVSPDSVYATVVQDQFAGASSRLKSVGGAAGYDYSLSLGIEMFTGLDPFFYPAGNGQLLSRAYGMNPGVGRVEPEDLPPDTTGDVGDGDRAYATAVATRKAGGRRGHGVHPGIIDGWNRGLTPPAEEVEAARAVLEEWAALDARGEAEGVLPDGRIVDRYEAARAREVLEWAERSAEQDAYKAMRSEDARRREQAGDLPAGIPA